MITALTILSTGGAPASTPGGAAQAAVSPTESVKRTIDEVIRILDDREMQRPGRLMERRKLLEKVIAARFDYREMAKRTLPKQWKTLSEAERKEFVDLFQSFLSSSYADKIEGYAGEQVRYLAERREGDYAEVRTRLVSEKTEIPIDYRLMGKSEEWFVYDVIADGISLVKNYRSQFDKIIRDSGYPELVEDLRKKSKEAKPP
ncbi:MAG: organic solvent tolerance ABC transporter substrate-binding protein, partial [Nitrospirae bacterium RIFCSPLOWO2_01_FULL_62_17]